jgi:hypothetical protein
VSFFGQAAVKSWKQKLQEELKLTEIDGIVSSQMEKMMLKINRVQPQLSPFQGENVGKIYN